MLASWLWLAVALGQQTLPEAELRPYLSDLHARAGWAPILVASAGFDAQALVRAIAKEDPDRFEAIRLSEVGDSNELMSSALDRQGLLCGVRIQLVSAGTYRLSEHGSCGGEVAVIEAPPKTTVKPPAPPSRLDPGSLESLTFTKLIHRDQGGMVLGASTEEYRVRILEQLRKGGYDARGAESLLFDKDASGEARYLLGGTVVADECRDGLVKVECEIAVEWQLFDTGRDAVVYQVTTRGWIAEPMTADRWQFAQKTLDLALDSLMSRPRFAGALQKDGEAVAREAEPSWDGALAVATCPDAGLQLPAKLESALAASITITAGARAGSGVLVSPDGFAITAAHVVAGADQVEVTTHGGLTLPATVLRVDRMQDVAVIDVSGGGHPCLPLADSPPTVGAELWAVGSPLGAVLSASVSKGVVSGLRTFGAHKFVQTDATLNAGNSGGPLVDVSGRVVAIVSWKIAAPGFEGLGFGVAGDTVTERLELAWGATSEADPAAMRGERGGTVVAKVVVVVDTADPSRLGESVKPVPWSR